MHNTILLLLMSLGLAACSSQASHSTQASDTVHAIDTSETLDTTPAVDIADMTGDLESSDTSTEQSVNISKAGFCDNKKHNTWHVTAGNDLQKLTLKDPKALCNDGTQAIIYLRKAANKANANRWVVYFQGGGSCTSYESCKNRYCSIESAYNASKMSSAYAPNALAASGILKRDARNSFGDTNQVFAYYCSSDKWSGTHDNSVLTGTDGLAKFSMTFAGHHIVSAIVATLKAGAKSDNGKVELPSINDARLVIWSGSSGGSNAVRRNIDRVAASLRLTAKDPKFDIRGVLDAGFSPTPTVLPEGVTSHNITENSYLAQRLVWKAQYDESCTELAAAPWKCADNAYTVLNHITTPFFQRHDLRDGYNDEFFKDVDEYVESLKTQFEALGKIRDTAVERDKITVDPGYFGPNCDQHTSLTSNGRFFKATIFGIDADSTYNFHDVLMNWMDGTDPQQVFQTLPVDNSKCGN